MLNKEEFRLSDGVEPTPAEVHEAFLQTLEALPEQKQQATIRLPLRVAVLVLILIALSLAGLAIDRWTVQWFNNERNASPVPAQQLEEGAVEPALIEHDLQRIVVEMTSAVWMDDMLLVTLEFTSKQTGTMPLPREAMGVDGLRHDHVWWGQDKPEILSLADFTARYGEPLVFQPGELKDNKEGVGVRVRMRGYDWLQQEERIGYLMRMEVKSEVPLVDGEEIVVRLAVEESLAPGFGQETAERMVVFSVPYKRAD